MTNKFDAADYVDEQKLKNDEGLRLVVYRCSGGHPTVGYGHKLRPGEKYPNGITKEKAEELFDQDVQNAIGEIRKAIPGVDFNKNQMTALVSLVFNCGTAPLKGTPGRLLREGKLNDAADTFTLYRHDHGKGVSCFQRGCKGLLKRRERERDLFKKPVNPPPA